MELSSIPDLVNVVGVLEIKVRDDDPGDNVNVLFLIFLNVGSDFV